LDNGYHLIGNLVEKSGRGLIKSNILGWFRGIMEEQESLPVGMNSKVTPPNSNSERSLIGHVGGK